MSDKRKAPPYSGIEDADTEQEFRRDTRPTDPPIPLVHRRPSALPEDEVLPPIHTSDLLSSDAELLPRTAPHRAAAPQLNTEPDVRLPSEMDTIETDRLREQMQLLEQDTVEVDRAVEPTLRDGFEMGEIASLPPMPDHSNRAGPSVGAIIALLAFIALVAAALTTLFLPKSDGPAETATAPIATATPELKPAPDPPPPVPRIPEPAPPPPNPEAFVVIVNAEGPVTTLDAATLKKLYLEDRTFEDGRPARVVGRYKDPDLRKRFLDKVLGVSHDQIKEIWAKGQIERYRRLPTDEEVIEYVAQRKLGLGYIKRGSLPEGDTRVKVAFEEESLD